MNSIRSIYKSKIVLDKEQHNAILHEIELVNFARIKIMLVILFVIQIMFIMFNDIHYFINPAANIIWKDMGYFVAHLLLLSTSVTGFIAAIKLNKCEAGKWRRVYSYFTPGILVIYLILISFISGLDALYIKNVSSLFIANLLICGGIFILNFPKNIYTYSIPFVCYIGSYFYLGFEKAVIYSNLVNGLIFFAAVVIISTTIYYYQYEVIAENIVLEKTIKKLKYISNHDPLTGLLNRRCFMEQMEKKQDGKMGSATASIVLADIDLFKNLNDKYGHPIGDLVLKKVSSVLMKHIKEEDLAVRWGGEEFLLFLYNTSMDEAYILTDAIRKAIEELTLQVKEYKIQVTASFGLATFKNEDDNSFYIAYKAVDIALYQAKNQGRNCVVKGVCEKSPKELVSL